MAEVNYVLEALKFMVLGMGVVFLFLIILVKAIELQAYLINKYFPEEETTPPTMPTPVASSSEEEERARVAAIIAAVAEFRKNKS
jgi:oxaloacetate decarboxylase gamma subunit